MKEPITMLAVNNKPINKKLTQIKNTQKPARHSLESKRFNPVMMLNDYVVKRLCGVPRSPKNQTPDAFGLAYEEVSFQSEDNLRLEGWFIPAQDAKVTVIVAHGYKSNKNGYLAYADFLNKAGYNVFMLDFRGHGQSEGPKGTSIGYMERLDLHGAVNYLSERGQTNLAVLGSSMGAAAAILAAAENPGIQAVIADSAYAHLYRSIRTQVITLYKVPSLLAGPFSRYIYRTIAKHHGFDRKEAHPVNHVHKLAPGALLLFHGEADRLTEVENSYKLQAAAQQPCELWTLPGVEHTKLFKAQPDEYKSRVLAFLAGVKWEGEEEVQLPLLTFPARKTVKLNQYKEEPVAA